MSAFSDAAAALFADPNLAVDAVYTPPAGAPVAVRVVLSRPDETAALGHTGTRGPVSHADVLLADVPSLAAGATLAVGGETFRISDPQRDAERLTWRCALAKVA